MPDMRTTVPLQPAPKQYCRGWSPPSGTGESCTFLLPLPLLPTRSQPRLCVLLLVRFIWHAARQEAGGAACLLEATRNGVRPLSLGRGLRRTFLEDGDTVRLSGYCQGDGFRVGFGACVGTVLPASA